MEVRKKNSLFHQFLQLRQSSSLTFDSRKSTCKGQRDSMRFKKLHKYKANSVQGKQSGALTQIIQSLILTQQQKRISTQRKKSPFLQKKNKVQEITNRCEKNYIFIGATKDLHHSNDSIRVRQRIETSNSYRYSGNTDKTNQKQQCLSKQSQNTENNSNYFVNRSGLHYPKRKYKIFDQTNGNKLKRLNYMLFSNAQIRQKLIKSCQKLMKPQKQNINVGSIKMCVNLGKQVKKVKLNELKQRNIAIYKVQDIKGKIMK